ncbi:MULTISPECIES: solute:sodium symporter family transporter [Sphingobacterium]|uniref:Solute:sodium symporter family transporter n=1 Tax=Sphingobacterium populi TaxID=1812824 RepID=A0ABW5UDY3_9SPHI|nr:solute:sodium symporter family transporter [Sphingobacterium sp. CFCC 11742]
MSIVSAISFVVFIFLGLGLTIFFAKKKKGSLTVSGFFLANRSNGFILIGASLYLSNLSANQLIGENESVYINNMSVIGWGISSVFAMLVVAEYIVPIYLKSGINTIPDFLEKRYDSSTKNLVSLVFLFGYLFNLLPTTLYGGAIALDSLFDVSNFLEINHWQSIWLLIWIIGLFGAIFTILGGFKAITISDTVLSIGLLILIIAIPYFGLKHLGNNSLYDGLKTVLTHKKHHLNAIGGPNDAVPFATLFTGMILANLYYWGMEQYIVQQIIAGKSLAESQKGIALACFLKLLSPLLINIPGLIAINAILDLPSTATVFPALAKEVLPATMIGLTTAVLLGAAINSFNVGLNGASSLFIFNIYKPIFAKNHGHEASDNRMIRTGKLFQIGISLFAMTIAPFIIYSEKGFYFYIQQISGIFSIPIFTIIFLGFFRTRIPPIAAKVGIVFYIICYSLTQFVFPIQLHFLHIMAILFVVTAMLMFAIGHFYPMNQHFKLTLENKVATVPWSNRWWYYALLLVLMLAVFWIFSPLGVA